MFLAHAHFSWLIDNGPLSSQRMLDDEGLKFSQKKTTKALSELSGELDACSNQQVMASWQKVSTGKLFTAIGADSAHKETKWAKLKNEAQLENVKAPHKKEKAMQ